MFTFPQIISPKPIPIQHTEHKWVANMLKAAQLHPDVRKSILNWRQGFYPDRHISSHPLIINDRHTTGTLSWSVYISQIVLNSGSKIRKHKLGFGYR